MRKKNKSILCQHWHTLEKREPADRVEKVRDWSGNCSLFARCQLNTQLPHHWRMHALPTVPGACHVEVPRSCCRFVVSGNYRMSTRKRQTAYPHCTSSLVRFERLYISSLVGPQQNCTPAIVCVTCVCVCVFFNKICLNHNIIFYSSQREMKVSVRSHTLKHNQKLNCT